MLVKAPSELTKRPDQVDGKADHHNHVGMLLPKDEENGWKEGCERIITMYGINLNKVISE